jgi:hypothetical protein
MTDATPPSEGSEFRDRPAIVDAGGAGSEPTAEEAPNPFRKERRGQKRRLHEAQKKARAVEKANDKRYKAANRSEKKDAKDMDMAGKKANKGKQDKADKKTAKVRRRQAKRQ